MVKSSKATVVRVTRSPMGNHRWCLELSCGHETWATMLRKPAVGVRRDCPVCAKAK